LEIISIASSYHETEDCEETHMIQWNSEKCAQYIWLELPPALVTRINRDIEHFGTKDKTRPCAQVGSRILNVEQMMAILGKTNHRIDIYTVQTYLSLLALQYRRDDTNALTWVGFGADTGITVCS